MAPQFLGCVSTMSESWITPPGIWAPVRSARRIVATWEGMIAAVPDASQYVNVGSPAIRLRGPTMDTGVTLPTSSLARNACPSIRKSPYV